MLDSTKENQVLYASAQKAPEFDADRATLLTRWLESLLPITHSLDVGCAGGGFSALLPHATEKWGLDFERHPDLPSDFYFLRADATQTWPVQSGYFDVVLAGEIIEHVLDTALFLGQCYAALQPGGHLLLTTPNLSSFANLRYWLQTDNFMWVDSGAEQFGHVRYLAPKRMRVTLQKHGFEVVCMGSVAGLERLSLPLRRVIQHFFPLRGNRLCVLARKP